MVDSLSTYHTSYACYIINNAQCLWLNVFVVTCLADYTLLLSGTDNSVFLKIF